MKRAIVVVMDGCGAGEAPDADAFNDHDHPATLRHVWEHAGGIDAPNLISAGLFRAAGIEVGQVGPGWAYGRLRERSMGKDSVTGHWEMMGVYTKAPFPTYPNGFPPDVIAEFEARIGRGTLGNRAASGTQIIAELGDEHVRTGNPIVYTSADSVFQIAAHEGVIPIERLYEICTIAREMLVAPHNLSRVIARPFEGSSGEYRRTERRKDFPSSPPPNLVDVVEDVFGIGVVPELFGGRGFRSVRRTQSNAEHQSMLWQALASDARFIFANFEDFDMLYGHRNDPDGFARALQDFDRVVGELVSRLGDDDLLILTADHGNDPTSASTDHSREFVPFLTKNGTRSGPVGDLDGMWNVGTAVAEHLGIDWRPPN